MGKKIRLDRETALFLPKSKGGTGQSSVIPNTKRNLERSHRDPEVKGENVKSMTMGLGPPSQEPWPNGQYPREREQEVSICNSAAGPLNRASENIDREGRKSYGSIQRVKRGDIRNALTW